jgi:hypothetical protein
LKDDSPLNRYYLKTKASLEIAISGYHIYLPSGYHIKASLTMCKSLGLEKQDRAVAEVEVDEVLGLCETYISVG